MAQIAPAPAPLSLKTQVWRFVVTGGLSAIVDFGLYQLLDLVAHLQIDAGQSAPASSPAPSPRT